MYRSSGSSMEKKETQALSDQFKLLGLEFVSVCEAAAIASADWIGCGNKNEADGAATGAMRTLLNRVNMRGEVVIGEGELDEAPMLYIGEKLGTGCGPEVDIAVDPLEGTSLVANGQNNSLSVLAAAPKGCLLNAPDMYMEKLAVGPAAAGSIDITAPLLENLSRVAKASGKSLSDLRVMIQKRPRHDHAAQIIRSVGGKVMLFDEGDVSCSIATALSDQQIDLFYGIGGAPEGVVSAVAIKCLGGEIQARLLPENAEQHDRCLAMGIGEPTRPLSMRDMVKSDICLFVATGITDSMMLDGVHCANGQWVTHTMLAMGTGSGNQVYFIKNRTRQLPERALQTAVYGR